MEELEIKILNLENGKLTAEIKKLSMEQRNRRKENTNGNWLHRTKKVICLCKLHFEFPECLQTACEAGSLLSIQ